VRDAAILILDEPTSGLDPRSEVAVMKALHNLMSGRTTFVIAHRMSTIAGADQVLVLNHGRIAEQGTHEELMQAAGGLYRSFLELQMKSLEPALDVSQPPGPGRHSLKLVRGQPDVQPGDHFAGGTDR
jgi:ABC-type transport system involved in cytochrome bd biosynthesis fused ATPase/permease subunit